MNHRQCPRCHSRLNIESVNGIEVDHCYGCGGSFLDAGEESAGIGAAADPAQWTPSTAHKSRAPSHLRCPADREQLHTHTVAFEDEQVAVELCYQCRGMWLDRGEGMTLRKLVLRAGQEPEVFHGDGRSKFPFLRVYLVAALTGLPLEVWNPRHKKPLVTVTLLVAIGILFMLTFGASDPQAFIDAYGLSNETAFRQPFRLITHGFLHAGLGHLLGNAVFLWIFGDNVESYLGSRRYLWLYAVALVAAALPTALGLPIAGRGATTILVGASGAISGLMGAYLVLFPRVKVNVVWLFVPLRLPIWVFMGLWVATQFVLMTLPEEMIAWEAHLAGFAAGLVVAWRMRKTPVTGLHLASLAPPT